MRTEQLADEISKIVTKVKDDYGTVSIEELDNEEVASVYVGFTAIADYYESLLAVIKNGQHLGAGALLRAQLEAWADIKHIFAKEGEVESRSKAYMGAVETFKTVITSIDEASLESKARSLRQVNADWTTSNIGSRVSAAGGDDMLTTYDILSYYAHPNPATSVMSLSGASASVMNDNFFTRTSVNIMIDTLLMVFKWGRDISVKPADLHLVVATYVDVIMPDSELEDMVQEGKG